METGRANGGFPEPSVRIAGASVPYVRVVERPGASRRWAITYLAGGAVKRFGLAVGRESGQATAEYALLLALVAAGLLVALLLFGTTIGQSYGRVSNRVNDAGGAQETGAASGGGVTDLPGSAKGGDQGAGGKDRGCGAGKGGGYGQGGGSGCGGGKDH